MAFINPYILGSLAKSPLIIERLVERIPPSSIDEHADPDRFSVREVVCHLADWEPFFLERLQGAVTIENFRITTYDEGQLAIDRNYHGQDLKEAIDRFSKGRRAYVTYARTLTAANLDRSALHPELGLMTAGDLIDFVLGHDVYHIEQMSSLLS